MNSEKRYNTKGELVEIIINEDFCNIENKKVKIGNTYTYLALVRILKNRNISDIDKFLRPSLSHLYDPFLLSDMDLAVARTVRSLIAKERICIVGDYDVDGITACSILIKFFQEIGANITYYIPKREDGYGLSLSAIKYAHQKKAKLIITVDNGISSQDEIEFAKQLGIDVIITDHHEPNTVPNAYAVVNPKMKNSKYPFSELAGVGVAFNFLLALRKTLRERNFFTKEPNLANYLDLVSLGTLADVVPLVDVNRVFVKYGLSKSSKALDKLKAVSNISSNLSTYDVAYKIAPRINSAGRLADANLAIDLFTTTQEIKMLKIANWLDELNIKRKRLQQTILQEAKSIVAGAKHYDAIVVSGKWHKGVIGIVAGNLAHFYRKPSIVISEDNYLCVGSGRSIESINLFEIVKRHENLLDKFGGHKLAVGLTLKKEHIEPFREAINKEVSRLKVNASYKLRVDLSCNINIFDNIDFLENLRELEPFGAGHEEPTFFVRGGILKDIQKKPYHNILFFDFNGKSKSFVSTDADNLKINECYSIAFYITFNKAYYNFTIKDIFKE
ncbi:MAG: single-stranded-DNA-specific exonuclease RecJ [Desulfurella sp.]|uniref:Single-stranded-DNA-specific exonuclease n=1 Tax=Desulfurella multipotens TaxID=79269 RepID=A0A1G6PI25_9BACT|nr:MULTISPECIES: single-stranded-DNA-specific exonuclease RecJ [Desulfurella]PMP66097.1 MAG: single-stranded-DNA-specific exonuclease RecJ [Desulfurella multipotens]PMP90663.1 MAG: single-stranded-DNA-specific exonuclease RecJ [Desulfurella sp.]SDC79708.1 single-stranded-DNA-specific exonuclease [Desulfurella multipotens]